MIKAIIPECYVDTCLIEVLLGVERERDGVNHGKGNSTVANKMKTVFENSFAVGIIDNDIEKRAIAYLKEFRVLNETVKQRNVLLKHFTKHHYIIQLCPESEKWICNVAIDLELKMTDDYDLPDNPNELGKFSKKVSVRNDQRFVKLFRDIKTKSEEIQYLPVIKLMNWLIELKDSNYTADLNRLEA